jgi:hypothetical protein
MKTRERSNTVDARSGSSTAQTALAAALLSSFRASYLYSFLYFYFYAYRRSFAVRPGEASA